MYGYLDAAIVHMLQTLCMHTTDQTLKIHFDQVTEWGSDILTEDGWIGWTKFTLTKYITIPHYYIGLEKLKDHCKMISFSGFTFFYRNINIFKQLNIKNLNNTNVRINGWRVQNQYLVE